MLEKNKVKLLKQNLFQLGLNFPERELPGLDEIIEYQKTHQILHPKLEKMINDDAKSRLYAAILLSAIDKQKSREILQKLEEDSAIIKIQYLIGHGFVEVPIKFAARSFRETEDIRKGFIEKFERLERLKAAIEHEARNKNISINLENLPGLEDILEKRFDLKTLENLAKDELVAKRFYAAELFFEIDETKAKQILEDLSENSTPVLVFFGDVAHEIPAKEIANDYLKKLSGEDYPPENQPADFAGRLFNSIKSLFTNRF